MAKVKNVETKVKTVKTKTNTDKTKVTTAKKKVIIAKTNIKLVPNLLFLLLLLFTTFTVRANATISYLKFSDQKSEPINQARHSRVYFRFHPTFLPKHSTDSTLLLSSKTIFRQSTLQAWMAQ